MLKNILKKIWKIILIIIVFIRNIFANIFPDKKTNISNNKKVLIKEVKESNKIDKVFISNIDTEPSSINIPYSKRIENIEEEVRILVNSPEISKEEKIDKITKLEKDILVTTALISEIATSSPVATKEKENNISLLKRNEVVLKEVAKENNIIIKEDNSIAKEEDKKPNKKDEVKDNIIDIPAIKKDIETDKYKQYIINSNKELKEIKIQLKEIEDTDINSTKIDSYKYKLEEIKSKIKKIRKQYYDFRHSDSYYIIEKDYELNELDKFEIIKSSENIDLYLTKCNTIITRIDTYKKYKTTTKVIKEDKVVNKKEESKKTSKEEEKPKILYEIDNAAMLIRKDVEKQRDMVSKIYTKINSFPTFERKRKKLGFFDNVLTNTLKLALSLLPVRIFKNKKLGLLTSGFMLNNSIRSMRKIVTEEVPCDYIEFNRRIKTETDIINSYTTICNDSLYQISVLKEEFIRNYGNSLKEDEIARSYKKLLVLESQILEQTDKLNNTKTNTINKVKKLGTMNNR